VRETPRGRSLEANQTVSARTSLTAPQACLPACTRPTQASRPGLDVLYCCPRTSLGHTTPTGPATPCRCAPLCVAKTPRNKYKAPYGITVNLKCQCHHQPSSSTGSSKAIVNEVKAATLCERQRTIAIRIRCLQQEGASEVRPLHLPLKKAGERSEHRAPETPAISDNVPPAGQWKTPMRCRF
jgi:hypothetical protein